MTTILTTKTNVRFFRRIVPLWWQSYPTKLLLKWAIFLCGTRSKWAIIMSNDNAGTVGFHMKRGGDPFYARLPPARSRLTRTSTTPRRRFIWDPEAGHPNNNVSKPTGRYRWVRKLFSMMALRRSSTYIFPKQPNHNRHDILPHTLSSPVSFRPSHSPQLWDPRGTVVSSITKQCRKSIFTTFRPLHSL